MKKHALFSTDRVYRYTLSRTWDEALPVLAIIGFNPSTADEELDDPTIRRCIWFATRDGYGGIVMLNLFAYRTTNPKRLRAADDPVGLMNDGILQLHTGGRSILLAWGASDTGGRAGEVLRFLNIDVGRPNTLCLGITKDGSPKHPLYLKSNTPMMPWEGRTPCDT